MLNSGDNPARDVVGCAIIYDPGQLPKVDQWDSANEIAKDNFFNWTATLIAAKNMAPYQIILGVYFTDAVTEKKQVQWFFLKWAGMTNGMSENILWDMSKEARNQLVEKFRDPMMEFEKTGHIRSLQNLPQVEGLDKIINAIEKPRARN